MPLSFCAGLARSPSTRGGPCGPPVRRMRLTLSSGRGTRMRALPEDFHRRFIQFRSHSETLTGPSHITDGNFYTSDSRPYTDSGCCSDLRAAPRGGVVLPFLLRLLRA